TTARFESRRQPPTLRNPGSRWEPTTPLWPITRCPTLCRRPPPTQGSRSRHDGTVHLENSRADGIPAPEPDPLSNAGPAATSDRTASGFPPEESCTLQFAFSGPAGVG